MRRAFSYVRFSSTDQAKGDSYRRQTEFSKSYCERHGLLLDDSLNLKDLGVSAFRGANVREGALAGFLELIKTGKVPKGSVLILESLDRLSRDQIRPALNLFTSILDGGVSIVTVNPEREYTPENQDPLALMEPLFTFARAHEESATKSKRVEASWDQRRKQAKENKTPMTTVCPAWLRVEGDKFVVVPERAKVVKRLFRMCMEGHGNYAIVKTLTDEGVPAMGRSGGWNTSYVRMLLSDRRVLGEYRPAKKRSGGRPTPTGEVIKGYYPAVIEEGDFYRCLGLIKRRGTKPGRGNAYRENVLSGLVWNVADGEKMHVASGPGRKTCLDSASVHKGKKAPRGRSIQYAPLEKIVLDILTDLDLSPEPEDDSGQNRINEIEGRLAALAERRRKLLDEQESSEDLKAFAVALKKWQDEENRLGLELEELKLKVASEKLHSLSETKSLIAARQDATGKARDKMNANLRMRIQEQVEGIYVLVENVNRSRKVCHVQVYLKNGAKEYGVFETPIPPSSPNRKLPPNHESRDFKKEAEDNRGSP